MDDLQSYLDALKGQQSMTHQAEPPPDAVQQFVQSLHGVDLTPEHLPGTQPKDYLRELSQNPDLLAKAVNQASNFNFGGVMAGRLAKTANLSNYKLATEMGQRGFTREQIHDATGWFLGADGNPKFEISDQGMKVKPLPSRGDGSILGSLEHFVHHDDLFKAYPNARMLKVAVDPNYGPEDSGEYSPDIQKITIGGKVNPKGLTSEQQKVLVHELQHHIQQVEGFSTGTNPNFAYQAVKDALWNKFNRMPGTHKDVDTVFNAINNLVDRRKELGYEMYHRTPGETEARNVAHRYEKVIPNPWNQKYPWETEDVPREKQFEYVRKALGK